MYYKNNIYITLTILIEKELKIQKYFIMAFVNEKNYFLELF